VVAVLRGFSIGSVKPTQFGLLGIAACLVAIHLTLVSRTSQFNLFSSSLLFWAAIAALVWSKRDRLVLQSNRLSALVGTLLLSIVLIRSVTIAGYDPVLRVIPFLSGLGIALLASGGKQLRQYGRELLILCFLVPSPGALAFVIDISVQTAQFATYLLWHLGFTVARQGTYINLPQGSIDVYPGCSGIESMFHLLGLSILFALVFPTTRVQKVLLPIVAIAIGFIVNGIRVALMAFLAAYSTPESLDYWHIGQGSLIFSMISVSMMGLFCFYLLPPSIPETDDSVEL
jgi:cyanoexosortase A